MKLKNRGFMLAEAMFAVLITLLVVLMLQNLLKNMTLANKAEHRTDDVVFSYVQFNRFLHDRHTKLAYVDVANSTSKKAQIVKVDQDNNETIYLLTFYKNMIRATTPEGGHMPLLLNVSQSNFVTRSGQLRINVTEDDGRKSELYFKLAKQPEKKAKNEQTKKAKS
ncbi:ComGF family competence protein [Lactobacillus sp. ESL0680]|uniref:ComGF family competence protein n=1 Tax=Lactobacillus sp. ESL0680 TaxID=2983210 RepID=UPI0023F77327|nr:ComGF family competence protein [Lactobacillus sp. ESL0680]WEV39215.1 ComGF family competence protein [Lactobacillus sp. ESL0680]